MPARIAIWLSAFALLATPAIAAAAPPSPLDALVTAAAGRLQTAEAVSATKWLTRGSIEDPARVQQVLAGVAAAAHAHNVDSGYVTRIFSDQIAATESLEYRRFAEWKIDPAAPTVAPDLASSRSAIDALNTRMVDEIATQWPVLHGPGCATALADAVAAQHLDADYQEALAFATHSYCE